MRWLFCIYLNLLRYIAYNNSNGKVMRDEWLAIDEQSKFHLKVPIPVNLENLFSMENKTLLKPVHISEKIMAN